MQPFEFRNDQGSGFKVEKKSARTSFGFFHFALFVIVTGFYYSTHVINIFSMYNHFTSSTTEQRIKQDKYNFVTRFHDLEDTLIFVFTDFYYFTKN